MKIEKTMYRKKAFFYQLNNRILPIAMLAFAVFASAAICKYFYGRKVQSVEEVSFESSGLTLVGHIYVPFGKRPVPAIILSHGTNLQGHNRFIYSEMSRRFAKRGYLVLSFDYRGYGDSQDPIRIETAADLDFMQDLTNAVSFLLESYGEEISEIILVGHSLGGGVSIGAGVEDQRINKIVAIGPPRRINERFLLPGAPKGKEWLQQRMMFDMCLQETIPLELIGEIFSPIMIDTYLEHYFDRPILFIDGERESAEDKEFMRNIFEKVKGRKTCVTIARADHYFGAAEIGFLEDKEKVESLVNPETFEKLINAIDTWIGSS